MSDLLLAILCAIFMTISLDKHAPDVDKGTATPAHTIGWIVMVIVSTFFLFTCARVARFAIEGVLSWLT